MYALPLHIMFLILAATNTSNVIDVPDTPLQSNNGVDMDLLMEGFKIAVERNGGTLIVLTKLLPQTLIFWLNRQAHWPHSSQDRPTRCCHYCLGCYWSLAEKYAFLREYSSHYSRLVTGRSPAYLTECQVKIAKNYATSEENIQKLWTLSEKLVGQEFPL